MSTTTLTSLAMLKVHIDQGKDYLDYLRPFILQILFDHNPDRVTDAVVRKHILSDYGLEIPERAVQIVLKRLSRKHPINRVDHVYQVTGTIENPGIASEKASAERHIQAVIKGLQAFSKNTVKPTLSDDEAVNSICLFLSKFNIPCLRAYLRGTAIPNIENHNDALIVLVSKYVLTIQETDPNQFDSFLVVLKGHMLANALLCPDLQQAPKTYKNATFYLDTPLLVRKFGLEGSAKQSAIKDLIKLLRKLGATIAIFSHSRNELERVIRGASNYVDNPKGKGEIVRWARRTKTTKSDLLLIANQIDNRLERAKIKIIKTPRYYKDFQIDETAFKGALDDEVTYHNPRAKDDDINSVRSIYVLRQNTFPKSLERSKATLVTSNSGFSQAAFDYGTKHEASKEVSTVITDFSLANMAWLKAPLGALTLPMTEVMAFSYAALQPSEKLMDKYMDEIDKLEKLGKISERDHQLLRSSDLAQKELVNLTLGEEEALTEQTVTETLNRVTNEIKKEGEERLQAEQDNHEKTRQELMALREKTESTKSKLYWRCRVKAKVCAWLVSGLFCVLLLVGFCMGFGLTASNPILSKALILGNAVVIIATLMNLISGETVTRLHNRVRTYCLTWCLRRTSVHTGLTLRIRNDK